MSNLRLINETIPTSVSSFQINDVFTDDFDIYKIVISDSQSSISSAWGMMRFVNSSGSLITASNYDLAQLQQSSYSAFSEYKNTNQTEFQYVFYDGHTSNFGVGATIYVFNPTSTSSYTFMLSQSSGQVSGGVISVKYIGVLKQTASMTGFGFRRSSGSYDSISVRTYGLRVDS